MYTARHPSTGALCESYVAFLQRHCGFVHTGRLIKDSDESDESDADARYIRKNMLGIAHGLGDSSSESLSGGELIEPQPRRDRHLTNDG